MGFRPPGQRPTPPIVLYSREGCHLCHQAAALLTRLGVAFDSVDIDADPDLRARFTECVPVVVIDGKERFRGHVDELLLRRLLARRDASQDS
jgi:glutaredoxin